MNHAIEAARKACHGRYGTDTTEIRVGVLAELLNLLAAQPAASTINGEPPTAHSLLAALIDIHDDEVKNPPEHRCYVEDAWHAVLNEARTFLATRQAGGAA